MTPTTVRNNAVIYIVGGFAVAAFGFIFSGPSAPNFWLWLTLPGLMVVGGVFRLLRR